MTVPSALPAPPAPAAPAAPAAPPTPAPAPAADSAAAERIGSLDRVVSPRGGLVSNVVPLVPGEGATAYRICQALLGDVGTVLPGTAAELLGHGSLDGAGTGTELTRAADLAVVEAVERWSSTVVTDDQLVVASARELAGRALDLRRVPRCSPSELAHPRCPLAPVDLEAPQRWVTGVDLLSGEPVLVPAVMTYLGMRQWPSERWWLPISTGCAAHTDLAAALVGGLFEVVERDALSLVWLHRLPLPEIELDDELRRWRDAVTGPGAGLTRVFDATLDLGVPTVYAVNRSDGRLATVVGAATATDVPTAVRKVLREVQSCRVALESSGPAGTDPDSFLSPVEGASYLGAPERVHEFDFLTENGRSRPLAELPAFEAAGPEQTLRAALAACARAGARPVAVDLTTREARRAGLHVVRVIVPELQPMTFSLRARYLDHPRLETGPLAAGYRPADTLNPLPQPMA